jgi:large subunit ribosomal protein L25
MEVTRLKAERRTALGRNHLRHLRREGWLPAVLYGGEDPQPVALSVSEWEMEQHVHHHHRVYQIEVEGGRQDAYLQDVQYDPLTDRMLHVDFKRIDLTVPIETEVEIEFVGHPVGAGKGGALIKDYTALPVKCLPTRIPERIQVIVAPLDMDQSLLAREVEMPPGVTLLLEPDEVVCHVAEMVVHAPPATVAESVEPEVAGKPAEAGAEAEGKKEGEAAPAKDKKDKEDKG